MIKLKNVSFSPIIRKLHEMIAGMESSYSSESLMPIMRDLTIHAMVDMDSLSASFLLPLVNTLGTAPSLFTPGESIKMEALYNPLMSLGRTHDAIAADTDFNTPEVVNKIDNMLTLTQDRWCYSVLISFPLLRLIFKEPAELFEIGRNAENERVIIEKDPSKVAVTATNNLEYKINQYVSDEICSMFLGGGSDRNEFYAKNVFNFHNGEDKKSQEPSVSFAEINESRCTLTFIDGSDTMKHELEILKSPDDTKTKLCPTGVRAKLIVTSTIQQLLTLLRLKPSVRLIITEEFIKMIDRPVNIPGVIAAKYLARLQQPVSEIKAHMVKLLESRNSMSKAEGIRLIFNGQMISYLIDLPLYEEFDLEGLKASMGPDYSKYCGLIADRLDTLRRTRKSYYHTT